MRPIRFFAALYISKAASKFIDLIAKGRGTNLPGEIALKIDPQFISHVGNIDPDRTVFVTGTNGKSTSVNLIEHILAENGVSVCCNLGGANMASGVSVPLLRDSSLTGKLKKDFVLMEVDERYLASVKRQLDAKYICVTNIQKDQSQRNGEVSFILEKIREALNGNTIAVLNRDEPNTFSLKDSVKRHITYGVQENIKSFRKEDDFFGISMPCPCCHDSLKFSYHNIDNIGEYLCSGCGFAYRGGAENSVKSVDYDLGTISIGDVEIKINYSQPAFLYCYSLAYTVLADLGFSEEEIKNGIESFSDIKGRVARYNLDGEAINYVKMKQENSETLQSSLNYISDIPGPKRLFIGFDEYLDFNPAYTFIFNLFDCDFRKTARNNISRWTVTSKALANLAAVKFCFDEFPEDKYRPSVNSTSAVISELLKADNEEGIRDNIYMIEEVPFWKKRVQTKS